MQGVGDIFHFIITVLSEVVTTSGILIMERSPVEPEEVQAIEMIAVWTWRRLFLWQVKYTMDTRLFEIRSLHNPHLHCRVCDSSQSYSH